MYNQNAEQTDEDREKAYAAEIDNSLKVFAVDVADALKSTLLAKKALGHLTSNEVYDIELAEGSVGSDAARELAEAAAHLRNVQRIVKLRLLIK